MLHGILGNKRNWRTPMREIQKLRKDVRVIAVDLRGHGDSQAFDTPFSIEAAAEDLRRLLLDHLRLGNAQSDSYVLCAHSFGGKVALKYLEMCMKKNDFASTAPSRTWIVDSLPGTLPTTLRPNVSTPPCHSVGIGMVEHVLRTLQNLPKSFPSRQWLVHSLMNDHKIPRSIAEWLTTSVTDFTTANGERQYRFVFNIERIVDLYVDYCQWNAWPVVQDFLKQEKMQLHFMVAGKTQAWFNPSNECLPEDPSRPISAYDMLKQWENNQLQVHLLPNNGHWVHAEDPVAFARNIVQQL